MSGRTLPRRTMARPLELSIVCKSPLSVRQKRGKVPDAYRWSAFPPHGGGQRPTNLGRLQLGYH
jgi:hypothetical protein